MSGGSSLPVTARVYIGMVSAAALALLAFYALGGGRGWPPASIGSLELVFAFVVLSVFGFLADLYPIRLPSSHIFDNATDNIAVSSSIYVAGLLLYGPAFAVLVAAMSILAAELWRQKPFYKVLFNVGQYVLTVGVSGLFLLPVETNPRELRVLVSSPESILAVLATLVAYFLLNTGLVTGILSMVSGTSFRGMWLQNNRAILGQYAGMLNVGLVAAILWAASPVAVVLLALPMLILQSAFRLTTQLKDETLRALTGIAEMVDARDSYAYHHSMEVARISTQIATKMGLPVEEVEMVKLAATLHDIGKIGTPDRVLHKPGSLDQDERAIMELHPAEGAKVLQYFSLFRPGVELVLSHQEQYNGSGYPSGLARDQIPLGARIIHVADAFQAMTSDRVYRKALGVDEAVRRLVAASGRDFDPAIVDALLEVLKSQEMAVGVHQPSSVAEAVNKRQLPEEPRYVLGHGGAERPDPLPGRP